LEILSKPESYKPSQLEDKTFRYITRIMRIMADGHDSMPHSESVFALPIGFHFNISSLSGNNIEIADTLAGTDTDSVTDESKDTPIKVSAANTFIAKCLIVRFRPTDGLLHFKDSIFDIEKDATVRFPDNNAIHNYLTSLQNEINISKDTDIMRMVYDSLRKQRNTPSVYVNPEDDLLFQVPSPMDLFGVRLKVETEAID